MNSSNGPKIANTLSQTQKNMFISMCDILHDCKSRGDTIGCFCDIGGQLYEDKCKSTKDTKCTAYDYIYNRHVPSETVNIGFPVNITATTTIQDYKKAVELQAECKHCKISPKTQKMLCPKCDLEESVVHIILTNTGLISKHEITNLVDYERIIETLNTQERNTSMLLISQLRSYVDSDGKTKNIANITNKKHTNRTTNDQKTLNNFNRNISTFIHTYFLYGSTRTTPANIMVDASPGVFSYIKDDIERFNHVKTPQTLIDPALTTVSQFDTSDPRTNTHTYSSFSATKAYNERPYNVIYSIQTIVTSSHTFTIRVKLGHPLLNTIKELEEVVDINTPIKTGGISRHQIYKRVKLIQSMSSYSDIYNIITCQTDFKKNTTWAFKTIIISMIDIYDSYSIPIINAKQDISDFLIDLKVFGDAEQVMQAYDYQIRTGKPTIMATIDRLCATRSYIYKLPTILYVNSTQNCTLYRHARSTAVTLPIVDYKRAIIELQTTANTLQQITPSSSFMKSLAQFIQNIERELQSFEHTSKPLSSLKYLHLLDGLQTMKSLATQCTNVGIQVQSILQTNALITAYTHELLNNVSSKPALNPTIATLLSLEPSANLKSIANAIYTLIANPTIKELMDALNNANMIIFKPHSHITSPTYMHIETLHIESDLRDDEGKLLNNKHIVFNTHVYLSNAISIQTLLLRLITYKSKYLKASDISQIGVFFKEFVSQVTQNILEITKSIQNPDISTYLSSEYLELLVSLQTRIQELNMKQLPNINTIIYMYFDARVFEKYKYTNLQLHGGQSIVSRNNSKTLQNTLQTLFSVIRASLTSSNDSLLYSSPVSLLEIHEPPHMTAAAYKRSTLYNTYISRYTLFYERIFQTLLDIYDISITSTYMYLHNYDLTSNKSMQLLVKLISSVLQNNDSIPSSTESTNSSNSEPYYSPIKYQEPISVAHGGRKVHTRKRTRTRTRARTRKQSNKRSTRKY